MKKIHSLYIYNIIWYKKPSGIHHFSNIENEKFSKKNIENETKPEDTHIKKVGTRNNRRVTPHGGATNSCSLRPRCSPKFPNLTATAAVQSNHAGGGVRVGSGHIRLRLRAALPQRGSGYRLLRLRAAPPRRAWRRPVRGRLLLGAVGSWTPGRPVGPEDRGHPASAPRVPPHHQQGALSPPPCAPSPPCRS